MTQKQKITVIGSGAWGCAIANVLADNNHPVVVYGNEERAVDDINKNKLYRLPDVTLNSNMSATMDLAEAMKDSEFVFIVTPSGAVKIVIEEIAKQNPKKDVTFILCSKGIDDTNQKLFNQLLEDNLPNNQYAILSGPNFAIEVAKRIPSVTTIASSDIELAQEVCNLMKNDYFLPKASDGIYTAQIAGIVKNILAIGCGIVDGLGLGDNTKSALIVKGIDEIILLIEKLGGDKNNFFSPAGFGDLFLTCSSTTSRNNTLGLRIGKGESPKELLADKTMTYEGAKSAESIIGLAKKHNLELPLCNLIYEILHKEAIDIREKIGKAVLS